MNRIIHVDLELLKQGGFIKSNEELKDEKIVIIEVDRNTKTKACPECKSNNIGRKTDPNILAVIVYFILGVLFPIFRSSYT